MCGPTIVAAGTEAQMRRFLRPIFTAEQIWCQLFSEPEAGSAVASLATRAEREGEEWAINCQKVWTSNAHLAEWGLLLAGTEPEAPKHRGITAFIIAMRQPGIEIRRLRQVNGSAAFNEVFFNDTRVPDALRLGEPGTGWRVGVGPAGGSILKLGNALLGQRVASTHVDVLDPQGMLCSFR
jgi:alkylation response protein AidB-like acyl-CoA dehydrogenase